jgi:hypothetical protein
LFTYLGWNAYATCIFFSSPKTLVENEPSSSSGAFSTQISKQIYYFQGLKPKA